MIDQRSENWYAMRKKHIGASDSIILMGLAPSHWEKKSIYDLWLDKQPNSPFDNKDNYYMKRGRELEPEALRMFENETGYLMSPKVMISDSKPFMMASLDGIDIDGTVAVEVKCPGNKDHECALHDEIPEKYKPQLQHQMQVAGISEIYYCSYRPEHEKPLCIKKVYRDQYYIDKLVQIESNFYYNHMITGIPPEEYIKTIDSDVWSNLSEEYKRLDKQEKEASKRKEEIRDYLIQVANFKNAKGNGIILQKVEKKGIIDYKNIPILKTIDMEEYRKPGSSFWQVKEYNDKEE